MYLTLVVAFVLSCFWARTLRSGYPLELIWDESPVSASLSIFSLFVPILRQSILGKHSWSTMLLLGGDLMGLVGYGGM